MNGGGESAPTYSGAFLWLREQRQLAGQYRSSLEVNGKSEVLCSPEQTTQADKNTESSWHSQTINKFLTHLNLNSCTKVHICQKLANPGESRQLVTFSQTWHQQSAWLGICWDPCAHKPHIADTMPVGWLTAAPSLPYPWGLLETCPLPCPLFFPWTELDGKGWERVTGRSQI